MESKPLHTFYIMDAGEIWNHGNPIIMPYGSWWGFPGMKDGVVYQVWSFK